MAPLEAHEPAHLAELVAGPQPVAQRLLEPEAHAPLAEAKFVLAPMAAAPTFTTPAAAWMCITG